MVASQRILLGHVQGAEGQRGAGYVGTSTTSLTIGATGSRTLTTQPDLAYSAGARVRVANSAANWMEGTVTAYNAETGALTFTADLSGGTGTLTSWNIGLAGTRGEPGLAGQAATLDVGTTTTLAPGSQATVTAGGTPQARTFSFGLPQGVSGPEAGIPALEIQLTTSRASRWSNSYGYGHSSQHFRLFMVSGSLQPGDKIYLLRQSFSGNGRGRLKERSYYHRDYGFFVERWSYPWTNARSGFRHPAPGAPNWGTQLATEWEPNFYYGATPGPGSNMWMWINWREMMRHKTDHRRRGTERIKFVIARRVANEYWNINRFPMQYGDCLNTLIVRLHHHVGPGATNRVVSVTVRP